MVGEVQTPLVGPLVDAMGIGDSVLFVLPRQAKFARDSGHSFY